MQTPEDLATRLLKESKNPGSHEFKILLHQLHESVNTPGDLSCLIGPVVKLLPCHNIQVKKAAYSALPRLSSTHPDASLLAVNTILHDCRDPNPAVKCIAVTTLCALPTLLPEHSGPVLVAALSDGNPHVRRAAVAGCGKVVRTAPGLLQELGLIDRLYESIRDEDAVVVTSSLLVLDGALAGEGGVVVTRHMARHLLSHLKDFPPPQLATVLQVLAKYRPSSESELFQELSVLDPFLGHTDAPVVVSCARLFLTLTMHLQTQLVQDIVQRTVPTLHLFLQPTSSSEDSNYILDFLLEMKTQKSLNWLTEFSDSPHLFYPKTSRIDDPKISQKKLQILPYVCTEEKSSEVLQVLKDKHCNCSRIGKEAIECVCAILKRFPASQLKVVEALLDSRNMQTFNNTLQALQDLDMRQYKPAEVSALLEKIITRVDLIPGKPVPPMLPVLLGDFGELIPDQSPYVLETLAQGFMACEDEGIKSLILTAALKLFIKMPAPCQHTLGTVLEKCCAGEGVNSVELQHRAWKYYHLLKSDVQLVKKILLAQY